MILPKIEWSLHHAECLNDAFRTNGVLDSKKIEACVAHIEPLIENLKQVISEIVNAGLS
jgi:septation ring formation regulator EzrA